MNLEKYRALFIEESTEHLGDMGRALVTLEKDPGSPEAVEAVDTLFRMAHSLKSMAASLSYDAVSELAHRTEDWLEPLRGNGRLPGGAVPLLFEVVGGMETMVRAIADADETPEPRQDLLELLATPAQVPRGEDGEGPRKKA